MTTKSLLIAVSSFVLSSPCTALAHDFWIEADDFTPLTDTTIQIRLREGVDFQGNTLPYIPEWFNDFSQTNGNGRQPVRSLIGNDPAATLKAGAGALLIGYQSNASFVELDADKFNSYLDAEGIEFIRSQRIERGEDKLPAAENFVRCAKTLLQTGPVSISRNIDSDSTTDSNVYQHRLGYTLELIPTNNPYLLQPGDELGMQLLFRGAPAAGLLVQAFTREQPEQKQQLRTDAQGQVSIKINAAGIWIIKAVNIEAISDAPEAHWQSNIESIGAASQADWQSYWATYLFAVEQ